jgi:hypothetical protein
MNLILGVNAECIVIGRGLIDDDDMRLRGRCEWKTTTGEGIPLDVLLRTSIVGLIADELYFSREWDLDSADYREALASAEEVAEATGADVGAVMASARERTSRR